MDGYRENVTRWGIFLTVHTTFLILMYERPQKMYVVNSIQITTIYSVQM